jgi:hypothetical protein
VVSPVSGFAWDRLAGLRDLCFASCGVAPSLFEGVARRMGYFIAGAVADAKPNAGRSRMLMKMGIFASPVMRPPHSVANQFS